MFLPSNACSSLFLQRNGNLESKKKNDGCWQDVVTSLGVSPYSFKSKPFRSLQTFKTNPSSRPRPIAYLRCLRCRKYGTVHLQLFLTPGESFGISCRLNSASAHLKTCYPSLYFFLSSEQKKNVTQGKITAKKVTATYKHPNHYNTSTDSNRLIGSNTQENILLLIVDNAVYLN